MLSDIAGKFARKLVGQRRAGSLVRLIRENAALILGDLDTPDERAIAALKRAVEDPDSPSGWKLDVGPFPGWETVPTW